MSDSKIFECVKIFEVEQNQPVYGAREALTHGLDAHASFSSAIGIDHCCWRECAGHTVLVLYCNNGYLVIRVTPLKGAPIIKQLKWFEGHQHHILDMALDPVGEWLACACLDGALYLLPVLSLTWKEHHLVKSFGPPDDISRISLEYKKAPPTCLVWWETMDEQHICITGSEVGEVTFFDLLRGEEVSTIHVGKCIDHILLAHSPDHSTHLLLGLRGGEWKRQLLEEHYHEVAGTSYSDAQASGFEVLLDDMVVKSFLSSGEPVDPFEVVTFPSFSEFNSISTQDWRGNHFLTAINLQNFKMEIFSYDFELLNTPLRTFQLVGGATSALLMDRMLFVISHNDESDPCSFTLSIMSSQKASSSDLTSATPSESNSILKQFSIPSRSNLVGFFSTSIMPPQLAALSCDQDATPISNLGGCVIVTKTDVFQCRQILSPEDIFLQLVLSSKSHEMAEEFGITYRLDICGLYLEAAKTMLKEQRYSQALKLFELSHCSSSEIIDNFSKIGRVPELVHYLHQLVYDDTGHSSHLQPKQVQNVLLKCFIHECLRCHGQPEGAVMMDKFSQFLGEKFLYDQTVAMELLVQCGLKEQLFDLAKTHHKLAEALEKMIFHGATEISHSLQSSLASRQYVKTLTNTANGLFLYQMTPTNFVRLLYAKPSLIPTHLSYLWSLLPRLDITNLLRLTRLFDPSHSTIKPLLNKAHSNRKHNSTGSLVSVTTQSSLEGAEKGEESSPGLEAYIEMFLVCMVVLNYRRRNKPTAQQKIFSLSPLRSAVSGSDILNSSAPCMEGSQWVRGSTLSCGLHHAAVVVGESLYTWGSTKNGKLGHGDIEEEGRAAPLCVETIKMLNIHVVSVSCGAEHTIALCQEGIFSWGLSSHGQLGHGDTLKKTRPVQIAALADKSIVSVVCGQYHSLALDDDHKVWSWGWGVHGQLGLRSVDDRTTPTHSSILDNKQVSLVAAGYGHSAILTAEGKLYTFGNGMYGQLGHGNTDKQTTPKLVQDLEDKTTYLLACGNFHTVVVTTDQSIYYWGKNFNRHKAGVSGSHGLKEYKRSRERQQTTGVGGGVSSGAVTNTLSPCLIDDTQLNDTIIQVSCGNYHSILLTSAGSVYAWGSNINGQLGVHQYSGELALPKMVEGFDGHKVVAIAAGDEFSLVVDEKGAPWVWGKGDKGQLGASMSDHTSSFHESSSHSRRSQSISKPLLISSISMVTDAIRSPRIMSPDPADLPTLELDFDWELPDFAAVDSPHAPYGRKALDTALDHLYGFYRTSLLLWQCHDWRDWNSMTTIANIECHWSQALRCALRGLVEDRARKAGSTEAATEGLGDEAAIVADEYLKKLVQEQNNLFSGRFMREALDVLDNLISSWEMHQLQFSSLEKVLFSHFPSLSYPLSYILRGSTHHDFSFSFHLSVAQQVIALVSAGHPTPDDIIIMNPDLSAATAIQTEKGVVSESDEPIKKLTVETSVGDVRLWVEILRNLTKDLMKHHVLQLSESSLSSLRAYQQQRSHDEEGDHMIAAFSCGHAYPSEMFQNRILLEFVERVQDFPFPLPHTLRLLQSHYKQSSCLPSSCPHCVFNYLRNFQLEVCPNVSIRPWKLS